VAQSGRRSEVEVERLQITLPVDAAKLLDRVVKTGRYGRNRNEVAARLVSDWLYDNSDDVLEAHFKRRETIRKFDTEFEKDAGDV
jgi:hypothetical protein